MEAIKQRFESEEDYTQTLDQVSASKIKVIQPVQSEESAPVTPKVVETANHSSSLQVTPKKEFAPDFSKLASPSFTPFKESRYNQMPEFKTPTGKFFNLQPYSVSPSCMMHSKKHLKPLAFNSGIKPDYDFTTAIDAIPFQEIDQN